MLAAIFLVAAFVSYPLGVGSISSSANVFEEGFQSNIKLLPGKRDTCGYDARGAQDDWLNQRLNTARMNHMRTDALASASGSARVERAGDIALIEDDGSILISSNKFDLKKSSILFTPEGAGYTITRDSVEFVKDIGFKIGEFLGQETAQASADNGFRKIPLPGARFPFYGKLYDTIYIGTNGYITFDQGDISARPSSSAFATSVPRIAALWSDLDVVFRGTINYNRLANGHVVTWNGVGDDQSSGANTFQIILYDDGHIAFVYKKIKARSSLVGISPGGYDELPAQIDFSSPPGDSISAPVFETFTKQKRLDIPALARAFYSSFGDDFDTLYLWTDFAFDNGPGYAHSFNVRNDIEGIGLDIFDRGAIYGSAAKLSTIIVMGDVVHNWPADPQSHVVGLNTAISIVCHEQGHRWLVYVRFDADHDIKDDLIGRDGSHWSFLADTRTNDEGSFSSLMEGNAWRDNGNGTFTTAESAVNYFSPLDQYLMGLRRADEVGSITYYDVPEDLRDIVRGKSPLAGVTMSATRKQTSVAQIAEREGQRVPDADTASKDFRIAFVLLTQKGSDAPGSTVSKLDRYRDALVRYFSLATARRGSLNSSLDAAE